MKRPALVVAVLLALLACGCGTFAHDEVPPPLVDQGDDHDKEPFLNRDLLYKIPVAIACVPVAVGYIVLGALANQTPGTSVLSLR